MASRNDSMPAWLPFGIAASFVIAIAAGARSGWKTAADQATRNPPTPEPGRAPGALQDWLGAGRLT